MTEITPLVPRRPPHDAVFALPPSRACEAGAPCAWPQICGEHRCIQVEAGDSPNFGAFLRAPEVGYIPEDLCLAQVDMRPPRGPHRIGRRLLGAMEGIAAVGICLALGWLVLACVVWELWAMVGRL